MFLDLLRVIAAALTCRTLLEVSLEEEKMFNSFENLGIFYLLMIRQENHAKFAQRALTNKIKCICLLQPFLPHVQTVFGKAACHLNLGIVMANGHLELLHLLHEVKSSRNYHRYSYLGAC